jgi:hypothetical protein
LSASMRVGWLRKASASASVCASSVGLKRAIPIAACWATRDESVLCSSTVCVFQTQR